jgi:phage tail sheath protein FI
VQAPGALPQMVVALVGHWQALAAQVAPLGQPFRQVPQLAGSLARSTQSGPGATQLEARASQTHAPEMQLPTPQSFPQAPQFVGSVASWTQAPGAGPQAVSPGGHRQAPAAQLAPSAQRARQVPQESGLDCRSKQTPPQEVWPVGQVTGLAAGEQARPAVNSAIPRAARAVRARSGEGMDRG